MKKFLLLSGWLLISVAGQAQVKRPVLTDSCFAKYMKAADIAINMGDYIMAINYLQNARACLDDTLQELSSIYKLAGPALTAKVDKYYYATVLSYEFESMGSEPAQPAKVPFDSKMQLQLNNLLPHFETMH